MRGLMLFELLIYLFRKKNLIFLNLSLTNNLHTTDLKTNNVHKANHFSNHKTKQMSKITLETK